MQFARVNASLNVCVRFSADHVQTSARKFVPETREKHVRERFLLPLVYMYIRMYMCEFA